MYSCIRNRLPQILNETANHILQKVNTHSYNGFINYVKNVLLESYEMNCHIENCFICGNV